MNWVDEHLWAFMALLFTPATSLALWRLLQWRLAAGLPKPDKALIVATEHGIILEAKGEIEAVCGWPPTSLVGQNITAIIPRALRDAHLAGMEDYRHSGEGPVIGKTLEFKALGPDDTLWPVQLTVFGYEKYSEFIYGLVESRR